MLSNIFNHPKTSIAGVLIAIGSIAGVLSQNGITLGHAGGGTVVALIAAIATALLGLLAKDPASGPDAGTVTKVGALLLFLATYRALFMLIAVVSGSFALCMLMTGCAGPAWLIDAESMMPVLVGSATSLLTLIAALTGNQVAAEGLAAVTAWAARIEAGLKDVQSLVADYSAAPDATGLQKVQAAANDVLTLLRGQDLTQFGLSAAAQSKIAAMLSVIEQQLTAWASLLPLAQLTHAAEGALVHVGAVKTPMSAKTFKATFHAALTAPTGHVATDAATAVAAADDVHKPIDIPPDTSGPTPPPANGN